MRARDPRAYFTTEVHSRLFDFQRCKDGRVRLSRVEAPMGTGRTYLYNDKADSARQHVSAEAWSEAWSRAYGHFGVRERRVA